MGRVGQPARQVEAGAGTAGLKAEPALDRSIESIVRRDRLVALITLGAVVALSWWWLWLMALDMSANPAAPPGFQPFGLALTLAMWIVMMAGMMLPSAAPAILLYGSLRRRHGERGNVLPAVWVFASGYLLAWSAFSVVATLVQAWLEHVTLLDGAMTSTSARLSASLLVVAGVYQLTPLKLACLAKCSNPLEFFMMRWRDGTIGAIRMGIVHGMYCVGCCWALMLLLFAAGVMNLGWVALIAAFVLAEKVWPSRVLSAGSGVLLIAVGIYRWISLT